MIEKGLQDQIWSLLPQEYREKVKEMYDGHVKRQTITSQDGLLDSLFGRHNLSANTCPNKSLILPDVKERVDRYMDSHTSEEVYEALIKSGMGRDNTTVEHGWLCRDENGALFIYLDRPRRADVMGDERNYWVGKTVFCRLEDELWPDLTWEDEPRKVTIRITDGNIEME